MNDRKNYAFRLSILFTTLFVVCSGLTRAHAAEPFEIKNGDRIVFLGSTFIERDVRYGCTETIMTTHFSEYDLTFRNLGWSGDNVSGEARASFDSVLKGYERLINQVNEAKPNVLLVSFGHNESFKGEAGVEDFVDGYEKLLDDVSSTNARIVLISPTLQENMGAPLPDPSEHNDDVRLYTNAIKKIAKERSYHFIDMTKQLPVSRKVAEAPLTNNGVHFTETGYWEVATKLMNGLGYDIAEPDRARLAPLRDVINEKNRLFFNRWRPQNETYITGFRKHEQGRHVAEFPEYDPLVKEQEEKIAALRISLVGKGEAK